MLISPRRHRRAATLCLSLAVALLLICELVPSTDARKPRKRSSSSATAAPASGATTGTPSTTDATSSSNEDERMARTTKPLTKRSGTKHDMNSSKVRKKTLLPPIPKVEPCPEEAMLRNPSVAQLVQVGNTAYTEREYKRAISCYVAALRKDKRTAMAWTNMALASIASGEPENAVEWVKASLTIEPSGHAFTVLASLQATGGDLHAAAESYKAALTHSPDDPVALNNLAGIYSELEEYELAVKTYKRALKQNSDTAQIHYNLGLALYNLDKLDECLEYLANAVELEPIGRPVFYVQLGSALIDNGDTESGLEVLLEGADAHDTHIEPLIRAGSVYESKGEWESANEMFQEAVDRAGHYGDKVLECQARAGVLRVARMSGQSVTVLETIGEITLVRLPNCASVLTELATVSRIQGDLPTAVDRLSQSLALEPNNTQTQANCALALADAGDATAALHLFEKVLGSHGQSAGVWRSYGNVLGDLRRHADAVTALAKAVELAPDDGEALADYLHAKQTACDWSEWDSLIERVVEVTQSELRVPGVRPGLRPLYATTLPLPSGFLTSVAHRYNQVFQANAAALSLTPYSHNASERAANVNTRGGVIRVGYLSHDWGTHPVGRLVASVPGLHDHSAFEIYCYATRPSDGSEWYTQVEREATVFRDVSELSHEQLAEAIHTDGIDILVDLMGYTLGARHEALALTPAPITVNFLGYPGTTGRPAGDNNYIVADRTLIPKATREQYTEAVIYMPHTYQVNDYRQCCREPVEGGALTLKDRPAHGLPLDEIVFANFNGLHKIDPNITQVWANILKRVPGSVLWLLNTSSDGAHALHTHFTVTHGIESERVVFAPLVSKSEHIARSGLADMFLDTLTYNAHTTAGDALWAGVPVVSLPGELMQSRVAASLLRAAKFPDTIVESLQQYEDLAVDLTTSPGKLVGMKNRLKRQRETAPAFDTKAYVKDWETALTAVWERYTSDEPAGDLDVAVLRVKRESGSEGEGVSE